MFGDRGHDTLWHLGQSVHGSKAAIKAAERGTADCLFMIEDEFARYARPAFL